MARARAYRNLTNELALLPDNNVNKDILEFLFLRLPILRKIHVRAWTGGATYGEFAVPRAVNASWVVPPTSALEHLQMTPLRRDPHEFLVAGGDAMRAGVVRHPLEGFVVVVHRDLAL